MPIFFHVRGAEPNGLRNSRQHSAGFLRLWIKFCRLVNFPVQPVDKSIETKISGVSILKRPAFFGPFSHSYPNKIPGDRCWFFRPALSRVAGSLVRVHYRQEIR
ncbi:hypothetical protein [Phaeobacter sp. 22II1-1F12B]|uniref:hypothetical protein n=1 Tax=Phaeobacter sp. 22II1-1F12B TaxID=1317111 RepID=UPI0011849BCE|nr:hypothetical protein [Phaeobacter sp. 22II1-1F12B]